MRTFIVLFFALSFLPACSVGYKAVGIFPSTGEEIVCDVDHNIWIGSAKVVGRSSSGVVCQGTSRVTNAHSLDVQEGVIEMSCNDGRHIYIEWVTETLTSGRGVGMDQNGQIVLVAFGGNENSLRQRAVIMGGKVVAEASAADAGSSAAARTPARAESYGFGTAFFISGDGVMVTNAHVVEGAKVLGLYDAKNDKLIEARVISIDKSNDVAVLKVEIKSKPIPLAAKFNQKRGEEVLTLGYPSPSVQGAEQKATFGRVNAITGVQDDIRFAQVDLPIQPGNSGGPLMNTRGEVTGIVTATIRESSGVSMQNVNYALKIDYLHPLLNKAAPEVRPSSGSTRTMPQLVESYEESVMMLVAAY